MPLLSLIIDALAFGSLYLQRQGNFSTSLGFGVQIIFTIILLIFVFGYRGQRKGRFNFDTWSHVFTLPFALIVISFIGNGLLAFLYYLNLSGANSLIMR
ncbi:hypothetical protein [Lacticaseibacillus porcinae]|uniref:hypothetical protein n=1 Tax=Lacticaseibacillus porcinae TaxID=1123687 RepID=UPI000F79D450|nr:hypothetical protein [Lacticaseibacillus porcinae]